MLLLLQRFCFFPFFVVPLQIKNVDAMTLHRKPVNFEEVWGRLRETLQCFFNQAGGGKGISGMALQEYVSRRVPFVRLFTAWLTTSGVQYSVQQQQGRVPAVRRDAARIHGHLVRGGAAVLPGEGKD
jgi:hypothetical protein